MVHLFTDSRYVVETMSGRFRRKANHEWWERLDKAAARHKVKWEWTRDMTATWCRKPLTRQLVALLPADALMKRYYAPQ